MALDHDPSTVLQLCWCISLAMFSLGPEQLAAAQRHFTPAAVNNHTQAHFALSKLTISGEKHEFHYMHALLPFLVGLFLTLYILGLIYHYRNIVLTRDDQVQRANLVSSSGTSINSEYNPKTEREKEKVPRTVSQSTAIKVKKFMSNFANMDTIQT